MTQAPDTTSAPKAGSLLDEEHITPDQIGKAPKPPSKLQDLDARLRAGLGRAFASKRARLVGGGVLAACAIGGGIYWYLEARTQPPPDYETASLDVLFDYTLLSEDFNKLPIEERLALIKQLIARLDDLGGNDSVMIAMFASMIAGEARAQLEENVSRLAIDIFDSYAITYDETAPPEDRAAYLEDKALEFEKTLEALGGRMGDQSDEERLARMRRQAKRDNDYVKSGRVGADEALRMFDVVNNGIGKHAQGHQQVRILNFMRDMAYTLREGGTSEPQPGTQPESQPQTQPDPSPAQGP